MDLSNWALGVSKINSSKLASVLNGINVQNIQCLCPSVFYSSTVKIEHNILRIEGLEQYSEPNTRKIELVGRRLFLKDPPIFMTSWI